MTSRHTDRPPSKSASRRSALRQRRALDIIERAKLSVAIQRRFLRSRLFLSSNSLGCYIAMHDEVDTSMIIERAWRARKSLYVPVTDRRGGMDFVRLDRDSKLVRNAFGLWEPAVGTTVPGSALDVVVTPLAAFDCERNRIGMGGGFYDRHFACLVNREVWLHPKLVGLAFACQHVEAIDKDVWDVSLYRVIDENGIH
jgi:5-formyltetrahydrofolate cyclo-ligase